MANLTPINGPQNPLGIPYCRHAQRVFVNGGELTSRGKPLPTAIHVCPYLHLQPCPHSDENTWALCSLNPDVVKLPEAYDPRIPLG